jgi:hypothetical protein
MLREIAPDLFVAERPFRLVGLEIGTRMTVIRLPGGELFLHSPVALDEVMRKELDRLGRVRFAVGPNRFHHLFLAGVAAAYPDAELWAAPGLESKRGALTFAGVLGDEPPPGWAGRLGQCLVRGFPWVNEVVFLHPPSRTLVLTDLAFHFGPGSPAPARLAVRLAGGKAFGPTWLERLLARDRAAARASLERVLAFDFERVIVAHGQVLERGGRERLRAGYAWLLG